MTDAVTGAPLRWGILGPGAIANSFADDLRFVANAQLVAVGSRDRERAVAFASRRAIPAAHGSYEALVADPNVDAVYIATPHSRHLDDALLCLDSGKHVLIEKPVVMNAAQMAVLSAAASRSGRFAMEAMWTRFFPLFEKVRELIVSERIGSVIELRADFGNVVPYDGAHRVWNPELGGGALLDIGVYPLVWAVGMLGWPTGFEADASLAANGVDEATGIRLTHEGGAVSLLSVSMRRRTPCRVVIVGTRGRISVAAPMYAPRRVTVRSEGGNEASPWSRPLADLDQPGSPLLRPFDRLPRHLVHLVDNGMSRTLRNRFAAQVAQSNQPLVDVHAGLGYFYEAEEVGRAVSAGLAQSDRWSLQDSARMTQLLDEIRSRVGLRFAGDS